MQTYIETATVFCRGFCELHSIRRQLDSPVGVASGVSPHHTLDLVYSPKVEAFGFSWRSWRSSLRGPGCPDHVITMTHLCYSFHMRKEVEVKVKVSNLDPVIKRLTDLGCTFSKPVIQRDITFVDGDYGPYDEFQRGKNILRIRDEDGKFIFTLKQPDTNEFDAIEHETEIKNPTELREMLILMGYKPVVEIVKKRVRASYENYEICLDKVDDLGSFVEVEKIIDKGDAQTVQYEIVGFLNELGVDTKDRVVHGYDTLIYMKQKGKSDKINK